MADTPHFAHPFRIGQSVAVVDQDTDEEILGCVWAICSTEIESRDEVPEFGVEDLAFRAEGEVTQEVVEAVREWEPRVEADATTEIEDLIMRTEVNV